MLFAPQTVVVLQGVLFVNGDKNNSSITTQFNIALVKSLLIITTLVEKAVLAQALSAKLHNLRFKLYNQKLFQKKTHCPYFL